MENEAGGGNKLWGAARHIKKEVVKGLPSLMARGRTLPGRRKLTTERGKYRKRGRKG